MKIENCYDCDIAFFFIQTVRNALYSSKPGGTKYMCKEGKDVLWTHIVQLYENEKYSLMLRRCRLTENHMRLNPYSKVNMLLIYFSNWAATTYSQMKVNLARDVLSWEVGKNLSTMKGAEGTSKFVLLINRWDF